MASLADSLIQKTQAFSDRFEGLTFEAPVDHVYNPLDYAADVHAEYLRRFARGPKKALFLGMNPGPYGMVQTGIPFGEIAAVRDWMKLPDLVQPPVFQHPRRSVDGFACPRSEVSGRRLWGLIAEIWDTPEAFFEDHLVLNYCPLAFLGPTGANITPDKLSAEKRAIITQVCDQFLLEVIEILTPQVTVGVGAYARTCLERVVRDHPNPPRIGTLLHPSPASPIANREWPARPKKQLAELGLLPPA